MLGSACLLELDPRNLSSMTQARDGTGSAPAADTDPVGRIYNQQTAAGPSYHSATSDATRGRLRDSASVFDGRRCIEFDGTDDKLTPASQYGPSAAYTMVIEFATWTTPTSGQTWFVFGTYDGTISSILFIANTGTSQTFCFGGGRTGTAALCGVGGINGAGNPGTARHILVVTYDGGTTTSTSSYTSRLNGVSQTVNTSASSAQHSNSSSIGALAAGAAPGKTQVGRLAVITGVQPLGVQQALEGWANAA